MSLLASLLSGIWPASNRGPGLQGRVVSALLHLESVEEVCNRHSGPYKINNPWTGWISVRAIGLNCRSQHDAALDSPWRFSAPRISKVLQNAP